MPDALFANVSVLLHADGADGSTTFTDTSASPKTVTAFGNAHIDTAQSMFGGAAALLDGSGDYLQVPGSSGEFSFGTDDFTIEGWFRPVTLNSESAIMWGSGIGWTLFAYPANRLTWGRTAPLGGANLLISGTTLTTGVWHHIAVVRASGTVTIWINGVSGGSVSDTSNYSANGDLQIGRSHTGEWFNGWVEEVRVTKGAARYTAPFTPPTAAFEEGLTGAAFSLPMLTLSATASGAGVVTATLTLPSLTLAATATGPTVGQASLSLPRLTLEATATVVLRAQSDFALPRLTLSANASVLNLGQAAITLPFPSVFATAHDATGERAFNGTLPSLGLTAFGGATAKLTAPALSFSITGRATIMASAPLTLPALSLSAAGRTAGQAAAALQLPAIRAGAFSGAVASVTIGGVTLTSSATAGGAGRATVTLPLFELTAGATRQRSGSANVSLPALRMATTGAAQIVIPGPRLTVIGTATVAVTYEAYALNLKHQNAESPDELTHYTNYPFDRIVRYQNSYFGVNATGLYLLEGPTDFAEPTPQKVVWSFKTCMTDFETPNLKTVNWAYFGGRMGPAATVSIHYGDIGEQSYAYTTPRGASAQNYRQAFGRGIKSRYYALEAEGDGELSLDSLLFDIAKMARRV